VAAMKRLAKVLMIASLLLCSVQGCGGLRAARVVKHPDAPMLFIRAWGKAEVSIYDAENNKMIDYGRVDLRQFEGWTLHKYNWEELIRKND
jgi:hypothetical protein